MKIEMNTEETEILIAALTALEFQKEFPQDAIARLRPFRSRLLQAWITLRTEIALALEAREAL